MATVVTLPPPPCPRPDLGTRRLARRALDRRPFTHDCLAASSLSSTVRMYRYPQDLSACGVRTATREGVAPPISPWRRLRYGSMRTRNATVTAGESHRACVRAGGLLGQSTLVISRELQPRWYFTVYMITSESRVIVTFTY